MELEELTAFTKSRGFLYPSSLIYGGFQGVYDYGPLGVEMKNNLKNLWWSNMVQERLDIIGLDSAIVTHPKVWEASGHTKSFTDPFVVCRKTGQRFRADTLLEDIGLDVENKSIEDIIEIWNKNKSKIKINGINNEDLTEPRLFNLLVETNLGDIEGSNEKTYLRGETCQGIYINFKNVLDSMRIKPNFGIAQIGKAFRNEISPRNFIFRLREFEQMEMQYFTSPNQAQDFFKEFKDYRMTFLKSIGLDSKKLRFRDHSKLVFYAKAATDIEYNYSFGWKELEGIHNRGDYDLTQHKKFSGQNLDYKNIEEGVEYTPNIIETSIGLDRLFLAILDNALEEETLEDGTKRIVMRLDKRISPYKVAVLPLMRKDEFISKSKDIVSMLNKDVSLTYDETQSIGKRYRRQDEIGTPFCITIDHDTLSKDTVTIRDRDTMKQDVVKVKELSSYISSIL